MNSSKTSAATAKPQMSLLKAIAILTENGAAPLTRDQLRERLPEVYPGKIESVLNVGIYATPGVKSRGAKGNKTFYATIPEYSLLAKQAKVNGAPSPQAPAPAAIPALNPPTSASFANPGTEKATCPQCGKEFKNAWALRVHTSRVHKTDKAPANTEGRLPCPECPKTFTSEGHLEKHLQQMHGVNTTSLVPSRRSEQQTQNFSTPATELNPVPVGTILPPTFNHCPNCGHGIHEIIAAMQHLAEVRAALARRGHH